MKGFLMAVLLISATPSHVLANDAQIPLIGLDDNGTEIEMPIKKKFFRKRMAAVTETFKEAGLKSLNSKESEGTWKFNTFVLGAALYGQIGLGDVIKGSGTLGVEFFFKR